MTQQLTRTQQVEKLIEKFGYEDYCRKAFERYNFPFMWSLDDKGEIQIDTTGLLDYLKAELSKGLSGEDIIGRDKKLQEEAVDAFYKEVFSNKLFT